MKDIVCLMHAKVIYLNIFCFSIGKEAPDANLSKHHQINLIQELNLHNFSYSGLSVDRKNSIESTIYLHGKRSARFVITRILINDFLLFLSTEDISRTVKLNSQVCKRATNLISRSNEVTFIASLKQITQNTGVIFSFADGIHRFATDLITLCEKRITDAF